MKGYIMTLLAAALVVSLLSIILPEGNVKKYARLVSSIIISLSVVAPFKSFFDISEIFDYSEIILEEFSREEAENIYINGLKDGIKSEIEEKLSEFGRVYVTVSDELAIKSIEIYTVKTVTEEDKELIKELYNPERLEIIYGES